MSEQSPSQCESEDGWREVVLREFTPGVSRLTLVSDPDALLLEERVLEGVRQRGFELIPFGDSIAFRYAYESRFRSYWDRGEQTELVVVLRSPRQDLDDLPYDLLQAGRRLSFNLSEIFPNLSYPVVSDLDRADLDLLYRAQKHYSPEPLGDNGTNDFALRHVFEIAPELIKETPDLLRVLFRRHHQNRSVPRSLDARFIELLRRDGRFSAWALEEIIPDREAFFRFIQERWPAFLDTISEEEPHSVEEECDRHQLQYSGPAYLPFDHHDVRVYIDTFFAEGLLKTIHYDRAMDLREKWVRIGIRTSETEDDEAHRLEKLVELAKQEFPANDARHPEWLQFAFLWAEITGIMLKNRDISGEVRKEVTELAGRVESGFHEWVERRFSGLYNLPAIPPVMVHQISRYLGREVVEGTDKRVALVVLDGLALDQWLEIRKALTAQDPKLLFRERAVFAWIPTITSISRQAIFAGTPPMYFPNSLERTDREPVQWRKSWEEFGLNRAEVGYFRGVDPAERDEVIAMADDNRVRVLGLVVNKVDQILHGMELGAAGMLQQSRQWAEQGDLRALLDDLLERNFEVFLTSDHGNMEAKGVGLPAEGVAADIREKRVRVFRDQGLRRTTAEKFPGSIEWPCIGLPEHFLPLMAPRGSAFTGEGLVAVAHGGPSLEELVVPWVKIERGGK